MKKTRVLVVDDSAMVRRLIRSILEKDPAIEVVGSAADPLIARKKIKMLEPDVLTLDIEMPNMDGITFLRNLMRLHPMPVVMVSALTQKGADATLEALEIGAVDYVAKPTVDLATGMADKEAEIIQKVKTAARARTERKEIRDAAKISGSLSATPQQLDRTRGTVIAIGASTGGVEAIKHVLSRLPANSPAIVVTQHISEGFSGPLARRLDNQCEVNVHEARRGQLIEPGNVYIAPWSHHLEVRKTNTGLACHLSAAERVSRHRPSVDVLFNSVATQLGARAVGILLTGMGEDGAQGLGAMKDSGSITIAQDKASSVVWGMPGVAVRNGAAQLVLPLDEIPSRILDPTRGVASRD